MHSSTIQGKASEHGVRCCLSFGKSESTVCPMHAMCCTTTKHCSCFFQASDTSRQSLPAECPVFFLIIPQILKHSLPQDTVCFATQHSDSKASCAKTLQDSYGSEANEKKNHNFFLNVFCLKAQFSPLSTVYPRAFTHFYAFLRGFTLFLFPIFFVFVVVLFGLFFVFVVPDSCR